MRDFRGEPVIVTFLYTHCDDTCPPQAQQIKGASTSSATTYRRSRSPSIRRTTRPRARGFLNEQRMTGRMEFVLGNEEELRPVGTATPSGRSFRGRSTRPGSCSWTGTGSSAWPSRSAQATPERIAHDVAAPPPPPGAPNG